MPNSPQANLPTKRSDRQLLEILSTPQPSSGVLPHNIVTANGEALPRQFGTVFRQIQNCGTTPVKYYVSNTVDCAAGIFHGILAGCVAEDDGTGGATNFDRLTQRVTILGVGGAPRVAVFVGINPDYMAPAP